MLPNFAQKLDKVYRTIFLRVVVLLWNLGDFADPKRGSGAPSLSCLT